MTTIAKNPNIDKLKTWTCHECGCRVRYDETRCDPCAKHTLDKLIATNEQMAKRIDQLETENAKLRAVIASQRKAF